VTVQGESERVDVHVHWLGGYGTQTAFARPVARLEQLSYYPRLLARVAELHRQGCNGPAIAARLNDEGWHPAKRCEHFNAAMVRSLLQRQRLGSAPRSPASIVPRQAEEQTLQELAHTLTIPQPTLYAWLRKGRFKGRRVISHAHPLWLITADKAELIRLRMLRSEPRTWQRPQ
jgi:transposase-like protein